MDDNTQTTLRVPTQLWRKFRQRLIADGTTFSEWARARIEEYLRQ